MRSDHAGPGRDSVGQALLRAMRPCDAQDLLIGCEAEFAVKAVPFKEMVYLPDEDRYEELDRLDGQRHLSVSGTQMRSEYFASGRALPARFTRPEVASILLEMLVPAHRQGSCVWFTGLSGAGKSAIADVLTVLLMEHGRQVTVLDGDVVRTHLWKGLRLSKEDRDTNIRRIGFVACGLCAIRAP